MGGEDAAIAKLMPIVLRIAPEVAMSFTVSGALSVTTRFFPSAGHNSWGFGRYQSAATVRSRRRHGRRSRSSFRKLGTICPSRPITEDIGISREEIKAVAIESNRAILQNLGAIFTEGSRPS